MTAAHSTCRATRPLRANTRAVHRQDRRFFVTDLDAPAGTKVNGTQLSPGAAVPIAKGAKIQLGQAVVELL